METKHQELAESHIGSFNQNDREDVSAIKEAAKDLIVQISTHCPDGRRKSKAFTDIETAAMYAVKSLFESLKEQGQ